MRLRTRTKRGFIGVVAGTALAMGLMLSTAPVASAAADCDASRFTNPDGTTDVTAYLQCTSPALSETTVTAGSTITFTGGGFASNSEITITLYAYSTPQVLGTITADADGNFTVEVTLPSDIPAGEHRLEASGVDPDGNPLTISLDFTVTAAGEVASVTQSGSLPYTGSDVGRVVGVGLAAVVVGGAAVWGTRRARANRTAA